MAAYGADDQCVQSANSRRSTLRLNFRRYRFVRLSWSNYRGGTAASCGRQNGDLRFVLLTSSAVYKTGADALFSFLRAAGFIFWSPSLVEKVTRG
jgi:hypothetical protein